MAVADRLLWCESVLDVALASTQTVRLCLWRGIGDALDIGAQQWQLELSCNRLGDFDGLIKTALAQTTPVQWDR